MEWVKTILVEKYNNVSPHDLDLVKIVNTDERWRYSTNSTRNTT
jgi:hypothetical protein